MSYWCCSCSVNVAVDYLVVIGCAFTAVVVYTDVVLTLFSCNNTHPKLKIVLTTKTKEKEKIENYIFILNLNKAIR